MIIIADYLKVGEWTISLLSRHICIIIINDINEHFRRNARSCNVYPLTGVVYFDYIILNQ